VSKHLLPPLVALGSTSICVTSSPRIRLATSCAGATLDELQANLQEVITMLLEDGEPSLESDFVGLQQIVKDIGMTMEEFLGYR